MINKQTHTHLLLTLVTHMQMYWFLLEGYHDIQYLFLFKEYGLSTFTIIEPPVQVSFM